MPTTPLQYLPSRITTLLPKSAHLSDIPNPVHLLRSLDRQNWAFFLVAFFAWTWDAFDFFTVSLTLPDLATSFNRSRTEITWGITLVLMFRTVGAVVFGIVSDRWGRRWPFVVNNGLFVVLELATGFCHTYPQFLACRALFGIAMGGLYGNAAATALEDLPPLARGLMSGLLQQGYAFGYLLATAFSRALVDTTPYGWRPLFWFGACPPVLIIALRLLLPETRAYQKQVMERELKQQQQRDEEEGSGDGEDGGTGGGGRKGVTRIFWEQGKEVMRKEWLLLSYMVLLMAGFNFMSHGSQDLYPVMLDTQFLFSRDQGTLVQVIANVGAMLGGTTIGFMSQFAGRRLSILVMCGLGGALLYPYTSTNVADKGWGKIAAAAFWEQFAVQGAWGVIPAHLMELSPARFRTFVVGTSYQLGNLVSSASSTIESTIGEKFPLPAEMGPDGTMLGQRYEYGKVICIFMGCVYAYVVVLTLLGPEYLGKRFDRRGSEALEDNGLVFQENDAFEIVQNAHRERKVTPGRKGGSMV
ncbi:major facilitator superfamily domain-containing protein [Apiosordaria backusii]|uniref:Major facilitator superfamily domain-containing protein n=1 Tax=Apiosordaria backusii TaxID=314023 RepID=A0AA40EME7_9PEZI|nr:major facilitator superfamily domain-containing protein [Apiosordaria backusii]